MELLEHGVRKFKREAFRRNRALFRTLARSQTPRVLFITCSDSRVVPSLITQTGPGDLFVEGNPGNIVPVYRPQAVGVSASIEYTVDVLKVESVVVCGHSDCGAMKGLLHPGKLAALPAMKRWLGFGKRAQQLLRSRARGLTEAQQLDRLTQLNVLVQMEHLRTHPSVARRLRRGDLSVYGWVYRIHDGEILQGDPRTAEFAPWPR